MTHHIDIGGRQGRGNPPVRHEIDDDGYLSEREDGGLLTVALCAMAAWALVGIAAFVLPDVLAALLDLICN